MNLFYASERSNLFFIERLDSFKTSEIVLFVSSFNISAKGAVADCISLGSLEGTK